MKIIAVDNYNRDEIADVLVCDNVQNTYIGDLITEFLNSRVTDSYYKLVEDDHRLWGGMEDLV